MAAMAAAAAAAAKRQRPQRMSIAGRSSEDKGASGRVTQWRRWRWRKRRAGERGPGPARGCRGRQRRLGAVTAPRSDPRGTRQHPAGPQLRTLTTGSSVMAAAAAAGAENPEGRARRSQSLPPASFEPAGRPLRVGGGEGAPEVGPRASEHARIRSQ